METGLAIKSRNLRVLFLFLAFILEKPQEEQRTRINPGWRAMVSEGSTSILNIPPNTGISKHHPAQGKANREAGHQGENPS